MLFFSYADEVSIGDEVMALGKNKLVAVKVINISSLIMQGNSNFARFLFCNECMLFY